MPNQPTGSLCQPMPSCISNSVRKGWSWRLIPGELFLQLMSPRVIILMISRWVCLSSIHFRRESTDFCHTSPEPRPVHLKTCWVSSGCPHLVHWLASHFPQHAIYLPTPHMPTVNFVMKCWRERGRELRAVPMPRQSTISVTIWAVLSFSCQYALASGE